MTIEMKDLEEWEEKVSCAHKQTPSHYEIPYRGAPELVTWAS